VKEVMGKNSVCMGPWLARARAIYDSRKSWRRGLRTPSAFI